jgi:hypothetical protein
VSSGSSTSFPSALQFVRLKLQTTISDLALSLFVGCFQAVSGLPARRFLSRLAGERDAKARFWARPPAGHCTQVPIKVFDLGAHQGIVALMLAREVGVSGHVVAFEPNPHNAAAAAKNRELNGMPQPDDGTWDQGRLDVDSVTIDGLADRFGISDVVFIDVEGAEVLALAGASRVLASGADFFVEVHVACGLEKLGGSVDQVLSYFPEE